MTLEIKTTNQFQKDIKRLKKRGKNFDKMFSIIDSLMHMQVLETKYKDHSLQGEYATYRECHIEPDWLLIYKIYLEENILLLLRSGTHSDLFD